MMRTIIGTVLALLAFMPRVAQAQTEQVFYYHTDAIGSVRMITDETGQVVARYDYLPFGEVCDLLCENEPAPDQRRQFVGKERDQETGLDYFGGRYYSSASGRFTTVDPGHVGGDIFDPQSWNAYAYALNNPLRFVDPLGTCSQDAKGNYVDGDDAGTLVAPGPCPRGKDGALAIGVTEKVSVKSKPAIVALAEGIAPAAPVVNGIAIGTGLVVSAGAVGGFAALGGTSASGAVTLGPLIPSISQGLTKAAARAAIGGMALSPAQESAALRAVARATTSSSIELVQKGQDLVVRITRAGANGYQVIESIINRAGGKQVIQKAYDAADSLVHYDPK